MILPSYKNVMVIVHGKSEFAICKNIQSNLRLSQEIIARDGGKTSIQITALMDILNDSRFGTYRRFTSYFSDKIQCKRGELYHFRLFTIMDTDDCTDIQKQSYISGKMFSGHWLCRYIVPIYNSPNLEQTMKEAGIEIKKKKDYVTLFPTNHGDLDLEQAKKLRAKLAKCNSTNMDEYLKYCIELAEKRLL